MRAATAAGYEVIALDAFADCDTRANAREVHLLHHHDGAFDAAALRDVLPRLVDAGVQGLAYGSGFEANPALLTQVAGALPLIGNPARVVGHMKRALTFFALLEALEIPYPEVRLQALADAAPTADWLLKKNGGSGGTHVRRADARQPLEPGGYYQRAVAGIPVSLLFVADGRTARGIGFNQQWLAPTATQPYRYGGAVSRAELPLPVRRQLLLAAQKLTAAVGLRGLNSIDGIMAGEQLWLLELNPRLSASFDLYAAADGGLFELHLQAAAGRVTTWPRLDAQARAHYIVYAPDDLRLPAGFAWPEWVADVPAPSSEIGREQPICTVTAAAATATLAVQLLSGRVGQLAGTLFGACARPGQNGAGAMQ